MKKVQLEKILSNYKEFYGTRSFTYSSMDDYLRRLGNSLKREDIVGIYDQSSIIKSRFYLLGVNGFYFHGEPVKGKEILFDELKEVVSDHDELIVYHNDGSTTVFECKDYDRKIIEGLLRDILKEKKIDISELAVNCIKQGEVYFDKQDYNNAYQCYKQAYDYGHYFGKVYLGMCYEYGLSVEENKYKATEFYREAIKQDPQEAVAYYKLGGVFQYYYKDHSRAVEYFKKAADLGFGVAMYEIGQYHELGVCLEQDTEKAIEYYKKSQNEYGYYRLGLLYYKGELVRKDYSLAHQYFAKAAEMGNVESCEYLFYVLYNSDIYPTHLDEVLKWMEKGIKLGSKTCEIHKAILFASGQYGEEYYDEACKILLFGAMNGNLYAQQTLIKEGCKNLPIGDIGYGLALDYAKSIGYEKYIPILQSKREELRNIEKQKRQEKEEIHNKTVKIEEPKKVVEEKLSEDDLLSDSDSLYNRLGILKIKDIIQYSIDHAYIPSKEYNDKLLEFLEIMLDDPDEYDYVISVEEDLYDVYKSLVNKRTDDLYRQSLNEYNNKQYQEAYKHFKELYELDRDDVAIYLGDIYYYGYISEPNYNEALKWYEEVRTSRGVAQRAECYMILGQVNNAKNTLVSHLTLGNEVIECLVKCLLKDAFAYSDKMIPHIKKYLSSHSLHAYDRSKLQSFIDEYDKVHLEENLLLKAKDYYEKNDIEKCIETYKECIDKCHSPIAMYKLALKYYYDLNDKTQYLKYLLMAVEEHEYPAAYYELALHCEREKVMDDCIRFLEIASSLGYSQAKSKLNQLRQPKVDKQVFMRKPIYCNYYCFECISSCPIRNITRVKNTDIVFGNHCIGCNLCVSACEKKLIKPVG